MGSAQDLSSIVDAIDTIMKWLKERKRGTYFFGTFENHTNLQFEMVHNHSWQGAYLTREWTLPAVIPPKSAVVWLHGTPDGFDGAQSCATFTSKAVEIFMGGWINNAGGTNQWLGSYLTRKGNIAIGQKSAAKNYVGWEKNGQITAIRKYNPCKLHSSITNEFLDPPRWGGHFVLRDS